MVLKAKALSFHFINALCMEDHDFKEMIEYAFMFFSLSHYKMVSSLKEASFPFQRVFLRDLIVKKAHEGALACHFDINKTLEILKNHFFWPKMSEDVHKLITRCIIYHMTKSHFYQHLYTPLPVPL